MVASPAHALTFKTVTSLNVNTDDTRATGHNEFLADGVRVWTEGHTSTDKAAGYFAVDKSLATAGEPSLKWAANPGQTSNLKPSTQLVVDFDGDGSADGILVGEPTYADGTTNLYGNNWWLSNGSKQFAKDGAPSHGGGFGSTKQRHAEPVALGIPNADIVQAGWSLGSGVQGDGTITQITVGSTAYRFAASPAPAATVLHKSDVSFDNTRANGHNVFLKDGGVHVYTDGSTDTGPRTDGGSGDWNTDKAAGYFDVNQPLAGSGEPMLDVTGSGAHPGAQLAVDFDGNGSFDGYLVGEPVYGNDWWLSEGKSFVKDNSPENSGGFGSNYHGTLNEWRSVFPDAVILQGGWSLGSGVHGDVTVNSQTIGTTKYVFADHAPTANDVSGSVRDDGTTTIQADASDSDGDALTYSINGEAGDASIDSNGVISYDPDGATGSDSFTYTVTDEGGATATANVDVTIKANHAPTAPDVTGTVRDDGTAGLATNATDADGDALTYTIGTGNDAPSKGTADFDSFGVINYDPTGNDQTGTDTFTYTVTDGHGGSATGTVTVTIGADAAPVTPMAHGSVQAGRTVVVTLAGTDSDGDTLTYTIPSTVDHGTATVSGDQVTFEADSDYHGKVYFPYTADDGHGKTTDGTVRINVGRAYSSVSLTTTPVSPTSHQTVTVHVVVTSSGNMYRGIANVYDGTKLIGTGRIHSTGLQDIVLAKHLSKGTHTIRVKYLGTKYTSPRQHSIQVTVR